MRIYTILDDKIYQSAKTQDMSLAEKKELARRVSIVVNLWHTRDDELAALVEEYYHISVPDGKTDIMDMVRPLAKKVASKVMQGKKLLSHCYGGRNRSGFFNALVMIELGYKPEKAVWYVKSGRPSSLVNENFVNALLYKRKEEQLSLAELMRDL